MHEPVDLCIGIEHVAEVYCASRADNDAGRTRDGRMNNVRCNRCEPSHPALPNALHRITVCP
jgi:hypothetical protein